MRGIYLCVFCKAHRLRINIIHIIFMTTCVQNDEGNNTNATQLMMIKVFERWEKAETLEYSWQNLADVLLYITLGE